MAGSRVEPQGETTLDRLRRMKRFLIEVWSELKKTTWPGRQEVYGTTMVVIVTVMICGVYLWVVDIVLSKGADALFRAWGQ